MRDAKGNIIKIGDYVQSSVFVRDNKGTASWTTLIGEVIELGFDGNVKFMAKEELRSRRPQHVTIVKLEDLI